MSKNTINDAIHIDKGDLVHYIRCVRTSNTVHRVAAFPLIHRSQDAQFEHRGPYVGRGSSGDVSQIALG